MQVFVWVKDAIFLGGEGKKPLYIHIHSINLIKMSSTGNFPIFMHHETVKAELKKKVKDKIITEEEANKTYIEWLQTRRVLLSNKKV